MTGASSAALLESVRVALSHELAQPLAVARGYVELLQSRDDEAMRGDGAGAHPRGASSARPCCPTTSSG